jgi:hypothetical protein
MINPIDRRQQGNFPAQTGHVLKMVFLSFAPPTGGQWIFETRPGHIRFHQTAVGLGTSKRTRCSGLASV